MVFPSADIRRPDSYASRCRRRRVACFIDSFGITESTRVLDVGGTVQFWLNAGFRGAITLLNVRPAVRELPSGFRHVQGDARDLSRFGDNEFDVVFSNSVIEHVGGWKDQEAMAREVQRVGEWYFVETPNRTFPIEPHFCFPCFQMLPFPLRRCVARVWPFGWHRPGSSEALADAVGIRLLDARDMQRLFPDAVIFGEICFGLTKSLVAMRPPRPFSACPGSRVLRSPGGRKTYRGCSWR